MRIAPFAVSCLTCCLLATSVSAGTRPDGFIIDWLVLGPYNNAGGANPGEANQSRDFLCDGITSEENILPEADLSLELPDAPGGCAIDSSSYLGAFPPVPTIQLFNGANDFIEQNALHSPNDNVMGYAWCYVNNITNPPRTLRLTMGVASDDGIQVEINRREVFNISTPRGAGSVGEVQNRFPVLLLPGGNLVQIKTYEGLGGWGFRARFEDEERCVVLVSGDGEIEVGTDFVPLSTVSGSATRAIVTSANTQADVTVTASTGGAAYTLNETFDSGWAVSSITGGGVAAAGRVTWTGITAASVSYRLTRATPFTSEEGKIVGLLSIAGVEVQVTEDDQIAGGITPFVNEVLLTPEFNLPEDTTGCTVTDTMIDGNWIGDGAGLTDANIVPVEGFEFRPAFSSTNSQAAGFTDGLTPIAQANFWTVPGDPVTTRARLGKFAAQQNGLINFSTAYGDQDLCMNVAYFYVVNNSGQNPLILHMGAGSDDSVGVRVNGHPYHTKPACRANSYFGDKFRVALDPGKNLFAVYTFDNAGGYDMTLRFEDDKGRPIAVATTLDPAGYDPNPNLHPKHVIPPAPPPDLGAYTDRGLVTRFLVPEQPFEQPLGPGTKPDAVAEDYITVDGTVPSVANIAEGAAVSFGSTGEITTGFLGIPGCGATRLVLFDGLKSPARADGDPGLFEGDRFYDRIDNYSSTMFFFLNNKTGAARYAYFSFASEDGATLFVNGVRVLESVGDRGYGPANTVQSGPAGGLLDPGLNLVQLSYTAATGGSGGRVAVHDDCRRTKILDPRNVEVSLGNRPALVVERIVGGFDCVGDALVTLRFSIAGGGSTNVDLVERLPGDVTGSQPSKGTFDGTASVLTYSGPVADGETITYAVSGARLDVGFCSGTVNGNVIGGQVRFRVGTDFCGDIAQGIYVECGGVEFVDMLGRTWSEDTVLTPSNFLTSSNDFTGNFGFLRPVDLTRDPLVVERQYEKEIFPTERSSETLVEYTFTNLPDGNYEVVLLFMEVCCSEGCDATLADPAGSAGACRVVDVLVNGIFPSNADSPLVGGADGDQYSQRLAGNNKDRVATKLSRIVSIADGKIVVQVIDLGTGNPPGNASIKAIAITPTAGPPPVVFHRGDSDDNGKLELTDAIRILGYLFLGGAAPGCFDAADADDNSRLELTDAVRILGYLFLGGAPPSPPGPPPAPCGTDAPGDELECVEYRSC